MPRGKAVHDASDSRRPAEGSTEPGRRVCIIGAGVAGLVAAKVMKGDGFDVTVFEKDSTVGGVWSPSRAYRGLRTNNPRETYVFSDFRYPETSDEFPTATQVYSYLQSYAQHFGIEPHLRLSTEVESVSRLPSGDKPSPGFRLPSGALMASRRPTISTLWSCVTECSRNRMCRRFLGRNNSPARGCTRARWWMERR